MPRAPDEGGGGERPPRIRPFLSAPPPAPEPIPQTRGPVDETEPAAGTLRPFVLTSGRVVGHADIDLQTQVTSRVDDPAATYGLTHELQAIVALCAEPISVAEISARLKLHLGVTKILVGDLRDAGFLDVHLLDDSSPHDPDTILRVIDGLRAFT
jgi:hypothetical protein